MCPRHANSVMLSDISFIVSSLIKKKLKQKKLHHTSSERTYNSTLNSGKEGSVTVKDMGRCKVKIFAQHDSMQPCELELVSYKTSCPTTKCAFTRLPFHEKCQGSQAIFLVQKSCCTKKHAFNIPLFQATYLTFLEENASINSRDSGIWRASFCR